MLKKLSFLLPALLALNIFTAAMELPQQYYTKIVCADGELELDQHDTERFGLFKNLVEDTDAKTTKTINLPAEKNIQKIDMAIFLEVEPSEFAKKLVGLNNEKLNELVRKAQYLQLSANQFEKLAKFAQKTCKNIDDLLEFESNQNVLRSVIIENQILTIKSTQLETLDGLEKLLQFTGSQNKWLNPDVITALDLADNRLKTIDLEKILSVFPYLKKIDFKGNQIETIRPPKKRPLQNCQININDNPIVTDRESLKQLDATCENLPKSILERIKDKIGEHTPGIPFLASAGLALHEGGLSIISPIAKLYGFGYLSRPFDNARYKFALLPLLFNQLDLDAMGRAALIGVPCFVYLHLLCNYIQRYQEPGIFLNYRLPNE